MARVRECREGMRAGIMGYYMGTWCCAYRLSPHERDL